MGGELIGEVFDSEEGVDEEPVDVYDEDAGKAEVGGMEGLNGDVLLERGSGYGFIEGESSGDGGKKGVLFCTGAREGLIELLLILEALLVLLGVGLGWSKKKRSCVGLGLLSALLFT
jgi:hypothetical protein